MPRLIAGAVLAAALGLAACGGGGDEQEASFNMTIGHLTPLTGYLSDFGPPSRKAADLAGDQIDKAIDQTGASQKVTIEHRDDKTDSTEAVKQASNLVTAEKAACLVGSWAPAVTIRVAKAVSIKDGVVQISPASTSDEISDLEDNGLVNRTAPPDFLQGPALADMMETNLGGAQGKRVNIGLRDDSYGREVARTFGVAWRAKGGQVIDVVSYGPEQRSYDSEAMRIVSNEPDAFVIIDTVDTYQSVGPALVRTGRWDPAKAFVTDGLASSDLAKKAGSQATEGLRGTTPGSPQTGAAAAAFERLFAGDTSSGRSPFDAHTFDAVILCYLAAVAAGSPGSAEMAKELQAVSGPGGEKYTWEQLPDAVEALQGGEDIDYEGASGPIDLNDAGDPTAAVYGLFRFRDGEAGLFDEVSVEQGAQ